MSETESAEPSQRRRAFAVVAGRVGPASGLTRGEMEPGGVAAVSFDRRELRVIFDLYGAKVAAGEWRDYALDFTPDRAVFSIFRGACEAPLFRIEKIPELARRQGVYAVIAATGLVLRRGHDLARVVGVLDRKLRLVRAD